MSTRKTAGIIVACSLAMVNSIASGTAMTVTLPDIGKDLNIATANLQWIISGYTPAPPFSLPSVYRGAFSSYSADLPISMGDGTFFYSVQPGRPSGPLGAGLLAMKLV